MIFVHYWQAFARLSAVYGGTYMLNKPECKVIYVKAFFTASNSLWLVFLDLTVIVHSVLPYISPRLL